MLTNESKDVSNSRDKDNKHVGKCQKGNCNGTVTPPSKLLPGPQQLGNRTADLLKGGKKETNNKNPCLFYIVEVGD